MSKIALAPRASVKLLTDAEYACMMKHLPHDQPMALATYALALSLLLRRPVDEPLATRILDEYNDRLRAEFAAL